MSEPEETCNNIKALKALNIKSLCDTCSNHANCTDRLDSDSIGAMKTPGVRKEHITSGCFSYQEVNPDHSEAGADLHQLLWKAGVKEFCNACPVEMKINCEQRKLLDDLTNASVATGKWVEFQVVSCSQTKKERLYQISESKR